MARVCAFWSVDWYRVRQYAEVDPYVMPRDFASLLKVISPQQDVNLHAV
jgi:hypothetical protein